MYYLLNPQGKTKKKASKKARKARSSNRRGTGTSSSTRRRKNPTSRSKSSMKTKRKKRARPKAKRRVSRRRKPARKNPIRRKARRKPIRRKKTVRRKAKRRNPVRRRKAVRRKAKRRNPVRRRKAVRRKAKRSYRRNPKKKGIGAFLPDMKEFNNVLLTGAQVMGGWAACASAAQLAGPFVDSMLEKVGLGGKDKDNAYSTGGFWAWQAVDVLLAFSVAGLAGTFMGPKIRNTVLLGGMMRVVWHVADRYVPPNAKPYVLADAPGVGDWITQSDVGRLPSPAVGDFITRRSMPVGSYAGYGAH